MCKKPGHEWEREYEGPLVYLEHLLPAFRVKFLPDVHSFSIEDGLAAALAAFESDRPLAPANAVIVATPDGAADDVEAGWDFGELPAVSRLSGGGEHLPAMLSPIRYFASQLGLAVAECGLDVLKYGCGRTTSAIGTGGRTCSFDNQGD